MSLSKNNLTTVAKLVSVVLIGINLVACSAFDSAVEGRKVNYKSANKLPPLDVPPDLTSLPNDDRYAVPDGGTRGTVSANDVAAGQNVSLRGGPDTVLPKVPEATLERSGSQRWLKVNKTPAELWPLLKDFWGQNGFALKVDSPDVGVMETDWSENRPVIQESGLRGLLSRALATVSSNGLLDKYRTRLERTEGGTEIYISHRGLEEVFTSTSQDKTIWQPRKPDPELEAEFLGRLLVKLGAADEKTKNNILTASTGPQRAVLKTDAPGIRVAVSEPFDRTWRRVGLALDRVGFAVEDRDRSKGIYFVRYMDPELGLGKNTASDKGFFASFFDKSVSADKKLKTQSKYRIVVAGQTQGTEVSVQSVDGQPEQGEIGKRILALLQDELK